MKFKPEITAVSFGAKVHVHATVTVPTTGYELNLKPTQSHKGQLDLILTPPPPDTAQGNIVCHPVADADIFIGEKTITVHFNSGSIHVPVKPITT